MFWRETTDKVKCDGFSGYKQRNKVCLKCLGGKLQEDSYGWCIFQLMCQKLAETSKQQTKQQSKQQRLMFLDLKVLTER